MEFQYNIQPEELQEKPQSPQPSQETPSQNPTPNPLPTNQTQDNNQNTNTSNENNSIFIGKKPIKNYLNSIKLQLKKSGSSLILIKARGKFISKAVDIAELSKRSKEFNLNVSNIKTNTEEYEKSDSAPSPETPNTENSSKKQIKVSTIEIHLSKK
tara:strand:- start:319 stop:786 length:468 start_codon:yes stop_codon:yes gene_type:complete